MTATESSAEFLESRHLKPGELSASSATDELGAAAAAELAAITTNERSVTGRYWYLGRLLTWARKPLTHGQWGRFLKQWKIDKSRAAKAMRIFRAFTTADAVADLTVAEAYERSAKSSSRRATSRKPKPAPAAAAIATPTTIRSWTKFAEIMIEVVERQLEEPEFLTSEEAAAALTALGPLLTALRQCEDRLRRRTSASNS